MRILRVIAILAIVLAVGWYAAVALNAGGGVDAWLNESIGVVITVVVIAGTVLSLTGHGGVGAQLGTARGRASRDFSDAPVAIGTLVDAEHTGWTVNDMPQLDLVLDVETPQGQRFRAATTTLFAHHELGRLTVGAHCPVRYRPQDLSRVEFAVDADPEEIQAAFNAVMVRHGLTDPAALEVAARGAVTTGVVTGLHPTGQVREDHSEVEVQLLVTRPDGSRYPATKTSFVPPTAIEAVQVGRIVELRVLPWDEQRIALALPVN
ncbi:hypothetical protein EXU48_10430 [Occultella glacieicola]|uniref:Uncharacterized protein n=1 Tax=Occultella glacieicola TaxID=2518684 RepID=A0ABY2E7N1_9MICO|nr:hypothetical protein [Occultella glacieicola]TDE93886.1 hypothetical protein EXU48_10430 [Occultella glacieicola]